MEFSREQAEKRNQSANPEEGLLTLEKGDLPAMMLAGFIVFAPVFLVLFALIVLAFIFL